MSNLSESRESLALPASGDSDAPAADAAIEWSTQEHLKREAELVDFFKKQGLDVYTPNLAAFREFAQKRYLASDLAKSWVPGMLDRINAI